MVHGMVGRFVLGAVVGAVGTLILRPAAVAVVRTGLAAKNATKSAISTVAVEARKIHREAAGQDEEVVTVEQKSQGEPEVVVKVSQTA